MAGKRKLFITHAGELAHLLVRAAGPGGLIHQFVRAYAERNDRHMLLNHPPQLREIESTIGREALLVMAAEVRRLTPRTFASRPNGSLRPEEAEFSEAFFAEFLASLARAMAGSPHDAPAQADTLQRDLEMYDHWAVRRSLRGPRAGSGGGMESPFPDRCAMLLDPSMMEQARRAAADFENELAGAAAKIFDHLGRGSISRTASSPRRRATKSARRVKKIATKKKAVGLPRARRPGRKSPRRKP
jgi:hypothetical protein